MGLKSEGVSALADALRKLGGDKAERIARAAEQGYDTTKKWYHGTKRKFDEFDPSAERVNRGTNVEGSYFSDVRDDAEEYGDVGEYFIRPKNVAPSEEVLPTPEMVDEYKKALYREWNNDKWSEEVLAPEYAKTGRMKAEMTGASKRKVLEAGGYDAVMDGRHIVMFNPTKIRSVDADFNPANMGKANIMGSASPELLSAIAAGTGGSLATISALRKYNNEKNMAATTGSNLSRGGIPELSSEAEQYGVIEAPKNPRMLAIADAIRNIDKRTKGSPANLMVPNGLAQWSSDVGYNQKPTTETTINAILDLIP